MIALPGPFACRRLGVSGQCRPRCGRVAFTLQRFRRCGRPLGGGLPVSVRPFGEVALGLLSRSLRSLTLLRCCQLHACAPRLRKTDSDGLLCRPRSMLAFANVFHFLTNELARLGGRGLAFALRFTRTFNCFLFRHAVCSARKHPNRRPILQSMSSNIR